MDIFKNYSSTTMLRGQDENQRRDNIGHTVKSFNRDILKHLPSNKDARVLEVGCGFGRQMVALTDAGYSNIWGVDISEEQIEYARNVLGIQNVCVADAVQFLEREKTVYDAIILIDVLEHLNVEYSIQLLNMIYQSLSNGGVLIIHVPNAMTPISVHQYQDITHQRSYTTSSVEQCLKMSGQYDRIQHFACPVLVVNFKTLIRRLIWSGMFNVLIHAYLRVIIGAGVNEGVYTENMMSVAYKKS